MADAVVFGKVAGEGAVAYVKENQAKDAAKALNEAANGWEQRFREVTGRTTVVLFLKFVTNGSYYVEQRRYFPRRKENGRRIGDLESFA